MYTLKEYRKIRHREGSPQEGSPPNLKVRHSFGRFATTVMGMSATTLEYIIKQVTTVTECESIFILLKTTITHYTMIIQLYIDIYTTKIIIVQCAFLNKQNIDNATQNMYSNNIKI